MGPGPEGGESSSAAYGRAEHKYWEENSIYGEEFDAEQSFTDGAGNRIKIDAVDYQNFKIKELKPDNARAIQRGKTQIKRYVNFLERIFPGTKWSGEVVTYSRVLSGGNLGRVAE
jgi:hypothetical protein